MFKGIRIKWLEIKLWFRRQSMLSVMSTSGALMKMTATPDEVRQTIRMHQEAIMRLEQEIAELKGD